jgi:hypothetical protein
MPKIFGYVRRNPSAGLLAVQLLGLLLYPLMEASPSSRALFGAFGLLVLATALWVVRRSPWLTWLGLLLAVPVVVLSVTAAISPRRAAPQTRERGWSFFTSAWQCSPAWG